MSGLEPIIAAEAAAATTAAASTTAAAATAEIVAAEAAAAAAAEAAAEEAARQAALNAFASSAGEAIGAEAAGATALEAAPSLLDPLSYLDPQYAAQNNLFGPNIEFMPTEAGQEILLRSGAETTSDALAKEALENYAQSADAVLQQGSTPSFQDMAWDKVLRQGMDADMPGATMRSIQAGLQNNALNTIGSLPQYLGMPAPPPGAGKALQAARLMSPQQDRGTRTNVAPPLLNKGREVNLASPIQGLLGGAQMPKRRRLSLI